MQKMYGKGKSMKRLISLLLVLVLMLALLCACTKKEQQQQTPPPPANDIQIDGEQDNKKEEDKVEKVYVNYDEKQKLALYDIKDKIIVNGRCLFDEESGILAAWPNSGIEFSGWFDGGIRLYFKAPTRIVDFYVVVDGDYENPKTVSITPSLSFVTLANVERGYHTIGIYKVEGAQASSQYLTSIEFKGKLDETTPLAKELEIEVIGDSISCGVGLVSAKYDDDAYYSYGAILARNLNARLSVVAVPGWGLACGVNNYDHVVPSIYDLTCYFASETEKWDFANNQKDVVIINLGTNDYLAYANSDRTDFRKALKDFIGTVRQCYPKAKIYVTYGMMNVAFREDFETIIPEFGDENIEYIHSAFNGAGIGNHPSAEAHVKYARNFDEKIRNDLGVSGGAGEIAKLIREKNKLVTTVAPKE